MEQSLLEQIDEYIEEYYWYIGEENREAQAARRCKIFHRVY